MVSQEDNSEEKTIVASDTNLKKQISGQDTTAPVLVVLIGPSGYQGKQWPLGHGSVIGRAVESAIFVDDRSLSRSHARLDIVEGHVSIVDLGSTNRTQVNGQNLPPMAPCSLKNNDQIKTGNVIFKYLECGNIEAVANQALFDKASRDALTGAHSKGAFLERGPEVMKRSEVLNEPLSLIVFDLDHFKKINDTHGHPGGDFVLRELGRIIGQKMIRSNDFFARYGGEEFVLMLSGTNLKVAGEIAERIRTTIQNNQFIFENKTIPVTISVGVSTKTSTDIDWEQLFERADKAMYQSKQSGRNKVTIIS
ncbi:MAG: GGDEF domain-containing protein [Bdellovibrionaceae bacterium]|nr:GGDEF domain-containing protein [Pseudobdellovibrionaceae bacterium]